ncbi:hypothetical protein [Cupriavidus sp. MP-37]|uniref:hypothetical protein n=1 Tax=Cupriavidus sp. MP-37 TaxID=2884455 RepID=UPI001D0B242B|nr:hypothetical protein [Cupriavidus sp. MP-37]UDM49004.1 hypothetical protein LIN44_10150 [Cupriavidus sp. MP-37]
MPANLACGSMHVPGPARSHALRRKIPLRFWLAFAIACAPTLAGAHAWNIPYYLPVPLWLYAYAATGTLIATFLVLAFAPGSGVPQAGLPPARRRRALRIPAAALKAGQIASALFLTLLIVSGMAGTQNPFQNISMAGFWIWFYLGSLYISAVLGDIYAFVNPFAWLLQVAARYFPAMETGRYRYPPRLACYPALVPYVALIALELFGAGRPRDVSIFLLAYAAYAIAGSLCVGRSRWLEHLDALGILCRLCAKLSPLRWLPLPNGNVGIKLRNPIADIAREKPAHMSLVALQSFMLSSTAYDALRDTVPWNRFFWGSVYPQVTHYFPSLGKNYALAGEAILTWQWLSFAAIGMAYYVLFRLFCTIQAICAGAPLKGKALNGKAITQQFCLALLPIALFYHVCHYFTLFLGQGRQALALASDPLGLGWQLLPALSTASEPTPAQSLINMGYIWHAQVLLILAGHILSVYVTHAIAARNRALVGASAVSQLPLLVMAIALTISGLWILSLPLA